jgi:hypothetical protein
MVSFACVFIINVNIYAQHSIRYGTPAPLAADWGDQYFKMLCNTVQYIYMYRHLGLYKHVDYSGTPLLIPT